MELVIGTLIIIICLLMIFQYYKPRLISKLVYFPPPQFGVKVHKNVMVPVTDGTKLATDIYRPRTHDKYPVIILRTPYGKTNPSHLYVHLARLFVGQGYVVIVQDVRGKYASEGTFDPYVHEGSDGNDLIEWAGKADWSNGNVAIVGFSYLGSCAWLAASYSSSYLKTIIPLFTSHDTYVVWLDKGTPYLKDLLFWHVNYEGRGELKLEHQKIDRILMNLPVFEHDKDLVGHEISTFRNYLSHRTHDAFWQDRSVLNQMIHHLNLPLLFFGGWYDTFLEATIRDFQIMYHSPNSTFNKECRLIIGPWLHIPTQKIKSINLGKNYHIRYQFVFMLHWLDKWLKDKPYSVESSPVHYFMMGKNEWRDSDEWPPKNLKYDKYFLNKSYYTRRKYSSLELLSTLGTPDEILTKHYVYDPTDPTPSLGSTLIYGNGLEGPQEQSILTKRKDVLTFVTEPLKEDLEIAGPIKLVLFVSSSAIDTDFCAKISDMHPNGKSYFIQSGFFRMRYRDSAENPSMIEPGKVYRIEIKLNSTAMVFLKKHRVQLHVTSSDFPHYPRNLNTGMNCEITDDINIAEQTIYMGKEYNSHLVLPVLQS